MNQLHKQILKSCRNTLSPLLEAESQRTCPRCSLIWIHFGSILDHQVEYSGRQHMVVEGGMYETYFIRAVPGSKAPRLRAEVAFPVAMLAGKIDHMMAVFASVEK